MININKLRQLFKETTRDLSIQIVRLGDESEVAMDGTAYQHSAEIVPDRLECLVTVTQNENLEGGILKDQLWLAGFINKNLNHGFLIRKIVNDPFPLHPKSKMGETVLSSVPKSKINISNDHKAMLKENAVLGQELKAWLKELVAEVKSLAGDVESLKNTFNSHTHATSAPGTPTGPALPISTVTTAGETTKLNTLEGDQRIDKILSDLLFIQEKNLDNSPDEN